VKPVQKPNWLISPSQKSQKPELKNSVTACIGIYWGLASVKSINGNHYVAAHINDATRLTKLYFQAKKSQTFKLYKKDKHISKPKAVTI
jgi:hypothetical protein